MAKKKIEDNPGSSYLVIQRFIDKDNSAVAYELGDNVGHFSKERLDNLVERGLVSEGSAPIMADDEADKADNQQD